MLRAWHSPQRVLSPQRYCWPESVNHYWRLPLSTAVARREHEGPLIPAIRLREYQEECIQSVLKNLKEGHKRLGVSLATGSGKTVIFTQLIDRVESPRSDASQTLILVHRRELVEQAARHCINAYPSKTVEIEMGAQHASGFADITVASIASLISGDRMLKFDSSRFKLVLIDEAHHVVSSSFMSALRHFHLTQESMQDSSPALVGVSATFSRFDGLRLSDAIDRIVYHKDYVDMIGENWLSDVIFTTVKSKVDLSKVKKAPTGDFQINELSKAVNTTETNEITFVAWQEKASGRLSTLVFCVDLQHVASLTACFRTHGIDAQYVTGDTPKRTRAQRLDAFKNREYPVLINCGVFTEGTDIPNIDCVILARPTKSRNLLVQMIGRGMRLFPGKSDCHVIDMVASLANGVVTTPTLFGLDPETLVEGANVEDMKSQKSTEEEETKKARATDVAPTAQTSSLPRIVSFIHYDSVHDLIQDTSSERHIRSISPLAWVGVGDTRYMLSLTDGSHLSIEQTLESEEGSFLVIFTQKLSETQKMLSGTSVPFMRPRQIAFTKTFEDALHAADTFATEKYAYRLISHNQQWRHAPATEGQLAFLNKSRPMKDPLTADRVTKGKAADMITKLKFGAKGHFQKLEAQKKRQGRAADRSIREEEIKQREIVRVGPTIQVEA